MFTWRSNFLAILAIILSSSFSFSIDFDDGKPAYTHLYEINKEWAHHKSIAPDELVKFKNDIDRISYHINLVEQELRNNIPNGITGKALENRLLLLTKLDLYGDEKVFPTNLFHFERTPYFIDNYGVHCAVGYLIMKSGHSDLSNRISKEHNYDYVADIKTPGVAEWAKEYGFELSELAWIQPGYSQFPVDTVAGGTDNTVTATCEDKTNHRLIFAGDFANIDGGIPCSGIGYYENGQMGCLGGGLLGTINHVYEKDGEIVVTGILEFGGINYSQAIYDGTTWSYVNIPGREGAEGIESISGNGQYNRELILKYDQGLNEYEIWRLSSSTWNKEAMMYGTVSGLARGLYEHAYGGQFDSLIAYSTLGDQTIYAHNLTLRENMTDNWSSPVGDISDSVMVVRYINYSFIIGGACGELPSSPMNQTCISQLVNDSMVQIAGTDDFVIMPLVEITAIIDIKRKSNNALYVSAGALFPGFWPMPSLGVVSYGAGGGFSYGLNNIGGGINSITTIDSILYAGGTFSTVGIGDPQFNGSKPCFNLLQTGHYDQDASFFELSNNEFSISPNPTSGVITVKSKAQIESIQVLDLHGKNIVIAEENTSTIDLSMFNSGTYLIRVIFENGQVSHRRVVLNH